MDFEALTRQLKKAFGDVGKFWHKRSQSQRRVLVVLLVLFLAFAAATAVFLNTPRYAVLYSNLTSKDAGDILAKLDELKVDAKPQGEDTILVAKDRVDWVRMQLAAAGYPKSSANLEILQQGSGFTMTEEDKAIYRRYQLQEDLQNAIRTFASVDDVNVSLHLPESSDLLIVDNSSPATAAVLLTLKPGASLTSANVEAISQLVQKSVPNLQPEGVTIMDSDMNLLTTDAAAGELNTENQGNLEAQVRDQFKQQILSLLQPVFGIGNVLAEVNVRLNFDDTVVESVRFEPAKDSTEGIVSEIETIRDVANSGSAASGTTATSSSGTDVTSYPVVDTANTVYEKNSEKVSYEINSIKEHLVKAKGTISNMSVSVVLNDKAAGGADYGENVRQLVATAIGVDPELITVDRLPFSGAETLQQTIADNSSVSESALRFQKIRYFTTVGLIVLAVLLIFFLLRFALKKPKEDNQEELNDLFPSLRRDYTNPKTAIGTYAAFNTSDELDRMPADLNDKEQVSKYVDMNPELVANIIRGWLADESR